MGYPQMKLFNTRAIIVLILTLANCHLLKSQSDTSWYRHYVMDSMDFMFPSGLEPCGDDAILLIGAGAPFNNPPHNRSALLRIKGDNGDIIWSTDLRHNPVAENSQIFFSIRGFVRLRDGSYIVLVDTINEDGKSGFTIHRIATDGSVVWQKDFGLPGQEILANYAGLAIGPDSMSFAVSARRLDTTTSNLQLFYIDREGEVVNHLNLNSGVQSYWDFSPMAMLSDSSFAIGLNLGIIDIYAPKWIKHISYSGQTLSTNVAWDFGWWSDLKRHPNGQVVAVSQSFSGEWSNREKHGLRTTLYTSDLDTVWSRVYNHFDGPLYYKETDFPGVLSFDSKGNIFVTGDGAAYDGVRAAHIISYSTDGEQHLIKRLGIRDDLAGYVQSISGKIVFKPNGILLAGQIGVNEMLLIKLDSTGCIFESDCDTDFLLNTREEFQEPFFDFRLFPNPTADHAEISMTNDHFQLLTKPKIHIVDFLGRLLSTSLLIGAKQELDLGSLPAGVYLVTVQSKEGVLGTQRLVKW